MQKGNGTYEKKVRCSFWCVIVFDQYGILSAVVSLLCYNYFFTEPYHTLAVNDPGYLITFSIMLTTSILTSALTTKEKLLTEEANERGKESL